MYWKRRLPQELRVCGRIQKYKKTKGGIKRKQKHTERKIGRDLLIE